MSGDNFAHFTAYHKFDSNAIAFPNYDIVAVDVSDYIFDSPQ